MRRLVATALFAVTSLVLAAPAAAQDTHRHSGNMRHVLNLPYEARNGTTPNYGTDIEFARLAGKQHALAGSYSNGMQIVDISRPERARIAAIYDCGVSQGDVQVFRRADLPGRTFATYTSDTYGDGTSTCYREAAALGFNVLKSNGTGKNGTFILEVTDPLNPKTLSFAEVTQGSHNQTVHPSGKYMYNSKLGPHHLGAAGHRGHRHHGPVRAEDGGEQIMTMAWYNGGVRVIDLSGLTGISVGSQQLTGAGMKEIGYYRIQGMDTWAAKTPRIDPQTGDFYLYGNDVARGLDVYEFTGAGEASTAQGTWMTPSQTLAASQARPKVAAQDTLFCLLPR